MTPQALRTDLGSTPHVAICLPTTQHRTPSIYWTMMFKLYRLSHSHTVLMRTDYRVDLNRTGLVELVLNQPHITHILWWDDDIWPPAGAVDMLLRHHYPLVSGVYRDQKGWSVLADFTDDTGTAIERLAPPEPGTAIWADMTGLGFCLMHRDIFTQLPRPWFDYRADRGEDAYLFWQIKQHLGLRVLVDGTVQCGHEAAMIRWPDNHFSPASNPDGDSVTAYPSLGESTHAHRTH